MGEAVEHIPQSVPPSSLNFLLRLLLLLLYVVRGLRSANVAAASPSARQGLVFRGQTAKFSGGYIVQLDSLLAQVSPHVSDSSSWAPNDGLSSVSFGGSLVPRPLPCFARSKRGVWERDLSGAGFMLVQRAEVSLAIRRSGFRPARRGSLFWVGR